MAKDILSESRSVLTTLVKMATNDIGEKSYSRYLGNGKSLVVSAYHGFPCYELVTLEGDDEETYDDVTASQALDLVMESLK